MKLKTNKSVAKRIGKKTKSGQYQAMKMSAQHRTTGKSKRTKQASRKSQIISKAENKNIAKNLPYNR